MVRRIPTLHKHTPPTQLVPVVRGNDQLPTPHDQATEIQCPNDDRIAAIERHLAQRITDLDNKVSAIDQASPVVVQDSGLDEHTNQRMDSLVRQIDTLRAQVEAVSDRPSLSPDDVNGLANGFDARVEKMISAAMVTVKDEIQRVKIDVSSVKRSSASELAEQVELIGNMVTETGKLVVHLSERGSELEKSVAETRGQLSALRDEFLGDLSATLQSMVQTLDKKAA